MCALMRPLPPDYLSLLYPNLSSRLQPLPSGRGTLPSCPAAAPDVRMLRLPSTKRRVHSASLRNRNTRLRECTSLGAPSPLSRTAAGWARNSLSSAGRKPGVQPPVLATTCLSL